MCMIKFKDGAVLKIILDDFPENPREWGNNGTMVCLHKRYNLGDKHNYRGADFNNWDELKAQIEADNDIVVILPLYLMDHSRLSIQCDDTVFRVCDGAGWDWGQVGFIFATRENLKEGGHPGNVDLEQVITWLRSKVEIYDQYIGGDVYGFVLHAPPTNQYADGKVIDSCLGFYGSDPVENGMLEYLPEKYRAELKCEMINDRSIMFE